MSACAGYTAPSGLPILLQIGSGAVTPNVTAHSFTQDGAPLDHCVFDETTYVHPDGGTQNTGRNILNARDAIVLIPRQPLAPGATYQVSMTVSGQVYVWTFTVAAATRLVHEDQPELALMR